MRSRLAKRSVDRRLRKLEAVAWTREWADPFSKLEPLALSKLLIADRDLVLEALAAQDLSLLADRNTEVFERWEKAFAAAVRELGLPSHFGVWEWMF